MAIGNDRAGWACGNAHDAVTASTGKNRNGYQSEVHEHYSPTSHVGWQGLNDWLIDWLLAWLIDWFETASTVSAIGSEPVWHICIQLSVQSRCKRKKKHQCQVQLNRSVILKKMSLLNIHSMESWKCETALSASTLHTPGMCASLNQVFLSVHHNQIVHVIWLQWKEWLSPIW